MFKHWPKIPRLENEVYHITEKIDGTNACIVIQPYDYLLDPIEPLFCMCEIGVWAQSRTRIITPEDDNFGFAKWVQENAEQLSIDLGVGYHFEEWWGQGINRGYGLDHKRFSLFNPTKSSSICHTCIPICSVNTENLQNELTFWKNYLIERGSLTVSGYMKPEGLVVYAEKARAYWKVILDK